MDSQVKDIKTLFNTLFKTFLPTKCIFPKKSPEQQDVAQDCMPFYLSSVYLNCN